ncbi:MAG: hypothetical protein EI684_15090 [Candidatus Viridilinea halotolerans]|uniref:Uncharacterized protein n=1 Tax=Candidatus Viridilinea halotolerans TaxID=2491704 RepID=A0A426TW39_9CHLR|nr:MAG: hypothetical protein EI684_15090 [Candidatus Viridilinea halotolerans]
MIYGSLVSENRLDDWVRSNARDAQGVIVELVYRLVAASSPSPKERRFPLADSIGQHGPDGVLDTDFDFEPFVPEGRSYWEIGTGLEAGNKATSDYRDLTTATPEAIRGESTFVFVTPLSGRRDWPHTWKTDAQANWLKERRQRNEWRGVKVIDGSVLIDWLRHFPAIDHWLAQKLALPEQYLQTPEQCWTTLRTIGEPPPLTPDVFLVNREAAREQLRELFAGKLVQLQLDTHFPSQIADFVAAFIAALDEDVRIDAASRCLIISNPDGWRIINGLRPRHTIVANFATDEEDSGSTKLLEQARRGGHAVIFASRPGGIPHPNRVAMPNPKADQLREILVQAGYPKERARVLTQKSGGNLNFLLRCLQNLSLMPEWAQRTDASELAIAMLLGGWNENAEADRAMVEHLSGNSYGEWIGTMRDIALRSGTPLSQRDGVWKVASRYESWFALGSRLFDEHLERFRLTAIHVLRERDPQFDLPLDDRYASSVHGKIFQYSRTLRSGLAETLALMGSLPQALSSCSLHKAETTATLAVREILADDDWVQWASAGDLLPLLAEASPGAFLDTVERVLSLTPSPFTHIFAQEHGGATGRTYITGLLWALETLAWDPALLIHVVVILGELAALDPGGTWANRPANSLSTILMPWYPQTCASFTTRQTAVTTLQREQPDIAWNLLLALLPSGHQMSMGTHRPTWRTIIPDSWSEGVSEREYWAQVNAYADLAVQIAQREPSKLTVLIERLGDLPPPSRDQLLAHLRSDTVSLMAEADRLSIWTALADLVARHRKFADTKWALEPQVVQSMAEIAERLAPDMPQYRHRRLFISRIHKLFDRRGNHEAQMQELDARRQLAVAETFAAGGIDAVLELASAVEEPWNVGAGFGAAVSDNVAEQVILPALIESPIRSLAQFAGGFIRGRFHTRSWDWVDMLDTSGWTSSQIGMLFAYLPFTLATWERVSNSLKGDEAPYWSNANVNPREATTDIEVAIDRLVAHGRACAAMTCLEWRIHDQLPVDSQQAVRVLKAVIQQRDTPQAHDVHSITDIITALQADPTTNSDDLFYLEWNFLPLLDGRHGARPRHLEQQLAEDPMFFCEVIRMQETEATEPTEHRKVMAEQAYRLLNHWQTPPGTQPDGSYNGDALAPWLEQVITSCAASGHLENALSMAGKVLIFVPPDPDGLWIHHATATALNAREAQQLRQGFTTGLFNARGVFWASVGREERELAEKYRAQADAVEAQGYFRLAHAMRDLAASYEQDAASQERDSLDDHV